MNKENKAIKYLEFLSNEKCECEACQRAKKEYKTILNLIDKQQKEIEELKQENDELDYVGIHINGFYEGEKKWKDKIREKIKELEEMALKNNDIFGQMRNYAILTLKELLEENKDE